MNRIAGTLTRRLALLTACAALTALPLLAQDTPPPPPPAAQTQGPPPGGPGGGGRGGMNPERRLAMMKDQLGLSDDQSKKIKAILDEGQGKMEGVRADTTLSQDDMRAKMMTLMQDQNSKIRAVLTADQQTKFDAMQQRGRRGGGGPGGPGGQGGPPPQPPSTPQL